MWQSPLLKALAITLALGAIVFGTFSSTAVCSQCGRLRNTMEFQVPLVGIPYFWFHTQTSSPLSAVLDQRGIRRDHPHVWRFCAGAGNGVMCAIGPGRHLLGAIHEQRVTAFVRNLIDYAPRAEVEEWVSALLDSARSAPTRDLLTQFPEAGFGRREDFDCWRGERQIPQLPFAGTP